MTMRIDSRMRAELRARQLHLLDGAQCRIRAAVGMEPPFAPMAGVFADAPARFGAFSYSYSLLNGVASMGRYCSVADHVSFGATEHPTGRISTSSFTYDPGYIWRTFSEATGARFDPVALGEGERRGGGADVVIGHDVWIGTGAYVGGGVRLGDGAVVGARAVVVKDVPPYAIVVGNPARIVRLRFPEALIEAISACAWWDYAYTDFAGLDLTRPAAFVEGLAERVATGGISPYSPGPIDFGALLDALRPAAGNTGIHD